MTSADGTTFIIAYQYANDEDIDDLNDVNAHDLTNKITQSTPNDQAEININNNNNNVNQNVRQEPLGNLGQDVDREFLENFLSGRECLPGGAGWWKYEICYGKQVTQFHVNKEIILKFK